MVSWVAFAAVDNSIYFHKFSLFFNFSGIPPSYDNQCQNQKGISYCTKGIPIQLSVIKEDICSIIHVSTSCCKPPFCATLIISSGVSLKGCQLCSATTYVPAILSCHPCLFLSIKIQRKPKHSTENEMPTPIHLIAPFL